MARARKRSGGTGRTDGGQFKPGHSGNPNGRPPRVFNTDSWSNVLTGLGTPRDKRTSGDHLVEPVTDMEARDLWRGDAIAKRIIELPTTEGTRQGFDLKTDDKEESEELCDELKKLDALNLYKKAKQYERAFGGAALMPVINDGARDLAEPLREDRIMEFPRLHLFEPRELKPVTYYSDLLDEKYGLPEIYRLNPIMPSGVGAQPSVDIHESRLIIFPGFRVSRQDVHPLPGWGDSVLTLVRNGLRDLHLSMGGAVALLQDFSQAVLQMDGLTNLLASAEGSQSVLQRLLLMDQSRSILRMMAIDGKDKFERQATPTAGLSDILDRLFTFVSALTGIPKRLLFGEAPAGLAQTGDSEIRNWYDSVSVDQEDGKPRLERIIRLKMLDRSGSLKGNEPDIWSVEWRPLWQPTDKEREDARLVTAQRDQIYIETQVISPEQVARARFGGDTYSFELQLSPEELDDLEQHQELVAEAQQASLKNAAEAAKNPPPPPTPGAPAPGGAAGGAAGNTPKPAPAKPNGEERADDFNPDQERDSDGRWTGAGGGGERHLISAKSGDYLRRAKPEEVKAARESHTGTITVQHQGRDVEAHVATLERDEHGEPVAVPEGEHTKETAPAIDARKLLEQAKEHGGFTYDPNTGAFPKEGYAVSIHPGHEKVFKGQIKAEDIEGYTKPLETFFKENPGAHLGAWYDAAADKWYLDVSHVTPNRDEAIRLAKTHNQEGIYDLGKGQTIIVKDAAERRIDGWRAWRFGAAHDRSAEDVGRGHRGAHERRP